MRLAADASPVARHAGSSSFDASRRRPANADRRQASSSTRRPLRPRTAPSATPRRDRPASDSGGYNSEDNHVKAHDQLLAEPSGLVASMEKSGRSPLQDLHQLPNSWPYSSSSVAEMVSRYVAHAPPRPRDMDSPRIPEVHEALDNGLDWKMATTELILHDDNNRTQSLLDQLSKLHALLGLHVKALPSIENSGEPMGWEPESDGVLDRLLAWLLAAVHTAEESPVFSEQVLSALLAIQTVLEKCHKLREELAQLGTPPGRDGAAERAVSTVVALQVEVTHECQPKLSAAEGTRSTPALAPLRLAPETMAAWETASAGLAKLQAFDPREARRPPSVPESARPRQVAAKPTQSASARGFSSPRKTAGRVEEIWSPPRGVRQFREEELTPLKVIWSGHRAPSPMSPDQGLRRRDMSTQVTPGRPDLTTKVHRAEFPWRFHCTSRGVLPVPAVEDPNGANISFEAAAPPPTAGGPLVRYYWHYVDECHPLTHRPTLVRSTSPPPVRPPSVPRQRTTATIFHPPVPVGTASRTSLCLGTRPLGPCVFAPALVRSWERPPTPLLRRPEGIPVSSRRSATPQLQASRPGDQPRVIRSAREQSVSRESSPCVGRFRALDEADLRHLQASPKESFRQSPLAGSPRPFRTQDSTLSLHSLEMMGGVPSFAPPLVPFPTSQSIVHMFNVATNVSHDDLVMPPTSR